MDTKSLKVGSLLLDTQNPRTPPSDAQLGAFAALIEEQGPKLLALMADIAANGLNPTDRLLVIPDGRRFVVVEGNRRVAALKILDNPDIAAGSAIARQAKKLSRERAVKVAKIDCAVATGRKEARPWIRLRHDGESEGAGTVRWKGRQRARFGSSDSTQSGAGNAFLNAVELGYPDDDELLNLAAEVGSNRLTTLGRLVQSPVLRKRADYVIEDGQIKFHRDAAAMRDLLLRLLGDLATDYGVTQLKSAAQRKGYVDERLPVLDRKNRSDEPKPLGEPVATDAPKPDPKPKPKSKSKPKPVRLFGGLTLDNLGGRVPSLLSELQRLQPEDFPNAANVLVRVLLEVALDQAISKYGWGDKGTLRDKLVRALQKIDSTGKDARFQAVRAGLNDGTSLYAVATMHSYLHNPYVHAGPAEARTSAANVAPFLEALDAFD